MDHTDQAFPKGDDAEHGNSGMTLLHYFMAHAPKVPAKWFKPEMEERPKTPPRFDGIFGKLSDHPHKDFVMQYWSDDADTFCQPEGVEVPAGLQNQISAWGDEYTAAQNAIDEWIQRKERERILQWPRYWAEEQIRRAQ